MIKDALKYFNGETPSKSVCDINTSYLNHIIAFAAEESCVKGTIIDIEKSEQDV